MKMSITKTITREASTEVSPELFTRFLRSLGASILDGTLVSVYQSRAGSTITAYWTLSSEKEVNSVAMSDDKDISLIAGINEGNAL